MAKQEIRVVGKDYIEVDRFTVLCGVANIIEESMKEIRTKFGGLAKNLKTASEKSVRFCGKITDNLLTVTFEEPKWPKTLDEEKRNAFEVIITSVNVKKKNAAVYSALFQRVLTKRTVYDLDGDALDELAKEYPEIVPQLQALGIEKAARSEFRVTAPKVSEAALQEIAQLLEELEKKAQKSTKGK